MFSESQFLPHRSVQAPRPTPSVMPSREGQSRGHAWTVSNPHGTLHLLPAAAPVTTAVRGSDVPGKAGRWLCHTGQHACCLPAASKSAWSPSPGALQPGHLAPMSRTLCKYNPHGVTPGPDEAEGRRRGGRALQVPGAAGPSLPGPLGFRLPYLCAGTPRSAPEGGRCVSPLVCLGWRPVCWVTQRPSEGNHTDTGQISKMCSGQPPECTGPSHSEKTDKP